MSGAPTLAEWSIFCVGCLPLIAMIAHEALGTTRH